MPLNPNQPTNHILTLWLKTPEYNLYVDGWSFTDPSYIGYLFMLSLVECLVNRDDWKSDPDLDLESVVASLTATSRYVTLRCYCLHW